MSVLWISPGLGHRVEGYPGTGHSPALPALDRCEVAVVPSEAKYTGSGETQLSRFQKDASESGRGASNVYSCCQ